MKRLFAVALIVSIAALFTIAAAPAAAAPPLPEISLEALGALLATWAPHLIGLVALIVLDVLLGIGGALRTGTFEWGEVANFYRSMVLPKLMGWIGLVMLSHFASAQILGPEVGAFTADGVAWAAYLAIVAEIGASIVENARIVYTAKLPWDWGETIPAKASG